MNIILISHGEFAKSLLETAEMILGKIENAQSVCLYPHEGSDDFKQKFELALSHTSGKTVVLCDIMGGTPCNVAMHYLDRTSLYSGMNLPMVISLVSEGSCDELIETARQQIYDVALQLRQLQQEDDE
ncbi:PTS sugar transporter subunit IIA [Testudinibacter aquarius]|uniref:PTS sugar transporter subunit IIA n=1 Tax=Testudinibacter aquarius TaxID=1524974 RepID=A0A4V2W180_9PAST|nr:PTS sugar transporter subunit IIA [Testudinibacter aquarius]TNG95372.1 PTS sugar transporter subunit IIA [Pasteurellaceae bacterium UScroc12]TNG97653.1 PTS sugar transporter subunit IIA [Pasteurellaceae bacterium USgator41]TNH01519.1 PTS sugar transporter subunit IIA [Pasteurellaceae bacterium UScroc31]TNH02618.1 PTS sugar transporter subunit IIA [Pasteurellaceae bacterium USgator11]KAE9527787.1 PTS sugar transporter subunit IIA [Testudinibacter aquarius]